MGVNSKLFVTVSEEQGLKVLQSVIEKISIDCATEINEAFEKSPYLNKFNFLRENRTKYRLPQITTTDGKSFSISFGNGESRDLFYTTVCHNDYSDTYKGEKLIFSLGRWGKDHDIMMLIAEAVKGFGDVYFTPNDCDQDFKKL